ncbi:hypothetical protein VZG28_05395 [Synechococcus elongatus IITB4]|uniref:hypothetical protein n=1 Tax=Synechococcus elongatus TaxID=32046 RepID=UPI0030D4C8D7
MDAADLSWNALPRLRYRLENRRRLRDRRQQILLAQAGFLRPSDDRPPSCRGCSHYYGRVHGRGDRLICAMHPYGPNAAACPDWIAELTGVQEPLAD